ncbi:MAG: hypothetical protein K6B41_04005, partial [Butyrivibrio sp.]|nr:hypothetical protein [Butyrivibrio sp.]
MKVMRRLGASILCMIMGIAFGIPGNLLVANAAGSSFTIPIQDFVNDTITSQTATIKLTNTTYQSYNKTDDCYVQMVQFDNSEDYSGWFAEIED